MSIIFSKLQALQSFSFLALVQTVVLRQAVQHLVMKTPLS